MKRRVIGLVVLVLAVLAMGGCDLLFGPRVDEVEPADLDDYTATQTVSSEQGAVEDAVFQSFAGGDGSGGAGAALLYILSSDEFVTELDGVFGSSFSGLINPISDYVESSFTRARSIVVDGTVDDDFTDDAIGADISITIEDETVNGSDLGPDGAGIATVQRFFFTGSGQQEVVAYDADDFPSEITASGSFDHDATITYNEFTSDGVVIIHSGRVNSEGDGRADMSVTETTADVSWRFGYAMSAGLSFSNTDTNEGGKLVLNFRYSGRENISFDADDTPEEVSQQLTGEIEVSLSVALYDNANNLVAEYTYTDEDLYDEYEVLIL